MISAAGKEINMKNKKKLIVLITLLLILVASVIIGVISCSSSSTDSTQAAGEEGLLVEPLQKHDLSQSVTASGKIESQTTISVTSDLNCKITQLNVQAGDYVNAGDVLCVFDTTDIQAQINTLEQQLSENSSLENKQNAIRSRSLSEAKEEQKRQLTQAQNVVNTAQNAYQNAVSAKADLDNAYQSCQTQIADIQNSMNRILQNEGETSSYYELESRLGKLTISANELLAQITEAQNNISACQSELDAANASYAETERSTKQQIQECQDSIDTQGSTSAETNTTTKELEDLRRKLDKATVVAEHSGLITSLNVTEGSIHSGGALMTIQDANALKLTVSIKETDILKLQEGMRAIVTTNAKEETELEGTVTRIINYADTSSGQFTSDGEVSSAGNGYSAEITLNGNPDLLLGMTANAKILVSDEEKTIATGYDSIINNDSGSYVYRAVPDKKDGYYRIECVPVTCGTDSDYYTAISSDELSEGDYIVLFPEDVNEGDVVQVDESHLDTQSDTDENTDSDTSEEADTF